MTRPATAASSAAPLHDRSWTPSISEASASATTYRIARERVRPSSSTSKTTSDLNAMMAATLLRAQEHATEEERRRDEEKRHKSPSPPIEPVSHMEADGSATPRRPSHLQSSPIATRLTPLHRLC
ncbi:Hypothetical protein, putative [Bodo saltans]|uniref:Uncharacterized protein n=1 Tax=Bodo saltans TaxID=75058 RepID=A0A0S4J9C0_BODSA|nr:Hypothetical protein, putative [Bodo saltans]|eukprot:CUG87859.1 Hypothetical protein, putative [Bodo saltans]